MALGYQNHFYLKQAQKKQQSLYDSKVLLEKHDPLVVHDSEETLQLAQESHEKMKQLNKEIKPANYTKINHLSWVFVSQTAKSREELYFPNDSKTANVSKSMSIPKEEFSNDTTPSVARKFLNEVYDHKDNTHNTNANTKFAKQSIVENLPKVGETHALSKPVTSNLVSSPQESKVVKNDKVIAPGMFRINPFKTSREEKHVRASDMTKPIIVSQPPVFTKKDMNSDSNGLSSTGVIQICLWCIYSGCSKHMTGNLKLLINFVWKFMGTIRFENDHVAAIMGFGQFCDSDLEVAFRRNACFVRNLEGVDLLKGDRSTNLYTINLHDMASTSPICLMARASSTKSWLWHQRLSHLNFDTINDLARNDLVSVITSSSYGSVWTNENCQYKWKASPVIIIRTDNGTKFKNHVLKEYFDSVRISHQMSSVRTPQQNGVVERRNRTLVEAARTILIFSRALLFLWAEAISTACFTQNHSIIHHRSTKHHTSLLTAENRISPFSMYLELSAILRMIVKTLGSLVQKVILDFSLVILLIPVLIDSELDLTYAPSTITTQQPSEGELDLLFEAMFDDYIGGQPSPTTGTVPAVQEPQVCQTSTSSTSIADTAPTPTNSSSHEINISITSQDVDELNPNAMVDGNTFINPFANLSTSVAESSSSQNVDPSNMHTNQLRSDGDICMYALTVSTMEPKNVKEAMTDPAWIDSMQEELLQFKRLDVWVSKPGLQSMTFGHISSGLDFTYAPSTITTQQPSEGELDLLFEAMYDDYFGGQPSATARTV
nr:integrase, catalytic region, zinc finger, CCHC-type, peptidase aspartic, catalytic [Tanacetum cinerariifolium]